MAAADTVIVILAAGKGTRMRSELAKVLHRAGGRTLLEHVIRACKPLKVAQILAVVGHQAEEVGALAESLGVGYGEAATAARDGARVASGAAGVAQEREAGDRSSRRCRCCARETLTALLDTHRRGEAAATVLSAEFERSHGLRPRGARFRRARASSRRRKCCDAGAARHLAK